jgi:hypothetical protein
MAYMTKVEIKAWEKAVEAAFAEWVILESIFSQTMKFLKSIDVRSDDAKKILEKIYKFVDQEPSSKNFYIPLAGNMEKILGDSLAIIDLRFSLLEIKADLDESTSKREWEPFKENAQNKNRGELLERIAVTCGADFSKFIALSKKCHFIMGLREIKIGSEVDRDEIAFSPYWTFVDPGVKVKAVEKLRVFKEKGVSFEEFSSYIDMLMEDAKDSSGEECEQEIIKCENVLEGLAATSSPSDPSLEKKRRSLENLRETCDQIKLDSWKLKDIKVKLVVYCDGDIRTFETKLPEIKMLLSAAKNHSVSLGDSANKVEP